MKRATKAIKTALITGGCNNVGFQTGIHLARKFPEGSMIYLTTKDESKIPELTERLLSEFESEIKEKLKFTHLDFRDSSSLVKLYDQIRMEQAALDVIGKTLLNSRNF